MKTIDLPVESIIPAPWNANEMDELMLARLRRSVERFGLVLPLVVRQVDEGHYEIIGGSQRFKVLMEREPETVTCIIVAADNAGARLLSQALNRVQGSDNLGLRAELLRRVMSDVPLADVLSILPETHESLVNCGISGQQSLEDYLRDREKELQARLHHLTFHLTSSQIEVVEWALRPWMTQARDEKGTNPNVRGNALYLFCHDYLERAGERWPIRQINSLPL
jgi:ParB-like chromosome segregation protein Spo0J